MKLNVILVTYNHSNYIGESLESILAQQTNFDFNIIVADDMSTDGTIEKIRSYEKSSSIPFIYLESEKNLGITKNYERAFCACDAQYVAVMEGDDIWTDPYRLQKHVNFLDHHYECPMTFNRYLVADFEDAKYNVQPCWEPSNRYQLITSRDIVRDNLIGNFSTCVYRKTAIDALPDGLFEMTSYDWITNIVVGKNGMIGYLSDVMSIYRIHSNGVWSGSKEAEKNEKLIALIDTYNEFTNHIFEAEFLEHKRRLEIRQSVAIPVQILKSSKFTKIRMAFKSIKDFTPPIIIYIFKILTPPKIWDKLKG